MIQNDMYVEDARDISIECSDLIEKRLREYTNIKFSNELEEKLDELYTKIFNALSDICPNDYKHHL